MEEADGFGATLFGEIACLFDEFFGEIESGEFAIAFVPESEGDAAGATAGLKECGVFVGEETFDQDLLGFPEAEEVRGARVVDDRKRIVEVVADGGGGNFLDERQGGS